MEFEEVWDNGTRTRDLLRDRQARCCPWNSTI